MVEAFSRGDTRGLAAINNSLVTLLPKKDGVVDLKDFLPISFIHGAARIIVKALANPVAPELPLLI